MRWITPLSNRGKISGLGSNVTTFTFFSNPFALIAWQIPTAVGAHAEKKPARSGFPVSRSVAIFSDVAASAFVHWIGSTFMFGNLAIASLKPVLLFELTEPGWMPRL